MPRKPRVEYSGALHHVITQGNQRQNLFHHDKDRELYLDRLEQYRKRYGFKARLGVRSRLEAQHLHQNFMMNDERHASILDLAPQ